MRLRGILTLPIATAWFIAASACSGAEIQLHTECRTDGGLILLSDLADVYSQDAAEVKKLSAIDVLAAPPAGERRYLRSREIQDILATRGINLRQLRFSGASQITVIGTLEQPAPRPQASRKTTIPATSPRQVTDGVRKAILLYLQQQSGSRLDWDVKFELTPEQIQALSQTTQTPTVSGGNEPWSGPQQFTLSTTVNGDEQQVAVRAEITLPPALVVAARSLPRGSLVHADDVRLQLGAATQGSAHVFQSLEEVIGKEVMRGIVEGQILDDQWVRRPVLVHKGEVVTVYARTAGIQIRTTAKAKEEGSRGELVTVETLVDHKTFFARVTGPQEVDVYAHAAGVDADAPEPSPTNRKPDPVGTAAVQPQAPLPTASLARAQSSAAGQVQQATAVSKVGSSNIPGGEPGSVLQQAALRGKSARTKSPVKQSIVPARPDSEQKGPVSP